MFIDMKRLTALFLALICFQNTYASKCTHEDVSEIFPVKILKKEVFLMDMLEYTIEVPYKIEGSPLESIYLFSADVNGIVKNEILIPIYYEINNTNVLSKFSLNPSAANYKLQIWYGGVCGPQNLVFSKIKHNKLFKQGRDLTR